MAAPAGNQFAVRDKVWRKAIERALAERSRAAQVDALNLLAEKLLQQCDAGDMTALKELGDRLDGKAVQQIEGDLNVKHEARDLTDDELVANLAAFNAARGIGRGSGMGNGTAAPAQGEEVGVGVHQVHH